MSAGFSWRSWSPWSLFSAAGPKEVKAEDRPTLPSNNGLMEAQALRDVNSLEKAILSTAELDASMAQYFSGGSPSSYIEESPREGIGTEQLIYPPRAPIKQESAEDLRIPGAFIERHNHRVQANTSAGSPSSPMGSQQNHSHPADLNIEERTSSPLPSPGYFTAPSNVSDEERSESALSYATEDRDSIQGPDTPLLHLRNVPLSQSHHTWHQQNRVRSTRSSSGDEELGSESSYLADEESIGNESETALRLPNGVPPQDSSRKQSKRSGRDAPQHQLLTTGKFKNGEKLKPYQLFDLRRLVKREAGEKVCGTDAVNSVGFLLAYQMGLGKTALAIALIVCSLPPKNTNGARASLVVVPNQDIMDQWTKEIKKFAPDLDACYYKSGKSELRQEADIVFITYRQLLLQYEKGSSSIFQYTWPRVICDECHDLKNPASKTVEAVWTLRKVHGLCLTGTPIQNGLLDYYPLFKFLGVTFQGVNDLKIYKSLICSKTEEGKESSKKLLKVIKQDFCIYRSFGDVDSDLDTASEICVSNSLLPERFEFMVDVALSPVESLIYSYLESLSLPNFTKTMRLRQACDHPSLVYRAPEEEIEAKQGLNDDGKVSSAAFIKYAQSQRVNILGKDAPTGVEKHFADSFKSAKLNEMLEILQTCQGQKTIIFTHFTSFLPAIAKALYGNNICWAEYTGEMSLQHKKQALRQIAGDVNCSVIVVSIQAGSTGLNITSCNNVILMEPWWNPSAEEQAIARAYRPGQTLPVNVFRLVVKNSIEESILQTQQQKRDLIEGTRSPDQQS